MAILTVEQLIYRLLIARSKNQPCGYLAAVKRREVLNYLRNKNAAVKSDRRLRSVVRAMQKRGYRIGSHSKYGYFTLKTSKDLNLSLEERQKKLKALSQSISWDRRAFSNLFQLRFKFKDILK